MSPRAFGPPIGFNRRADERAGDSPASRAPTGDERRRRDQ